MCGHMIEDKHKMEMILGLLAMDSLLEDQWGMNLDGTECIWYNSPEVITIYADAFQMRHML